MKASLGRIVHYVLNSADAQLVNDSIRTPHDSSCGNPAAAGDILPCLVCRVWDPALYGGVESINGQVFVDGNFSLWVTSAHPSETREPGTWHWPQIEGRPVAVTLQETCGPVAAGVQIDGQGAEGPVIVQAGSPHHVDSITRMDAELTAAVSSDVLLLKRLEPLALKLCHCIEEAGASSALTRASMMASNLQQILAAANRGELLSPHLAQELDAAAITH